MRFLELRIPPPVVAAAIATFMYLTGTWLPEPLFNTPARAFIAVAIAIAGVAVNLAGVWAFRRHRTSVNPFHPGKATSLVSDGIFSRSRNPMYLGFLLMLTGWAIWLSKVAPLVGLPLFMIYLTRFQILPEERVMQTKFGGEWINYQRRVRRWL